MLNSPLGPFDGKWSSFPKKETEKVKMKCGVTQLLLVTCVALVSFLLLASQLKNNGQLKIRSSADSDSAIDEESGAVLQLYSPWERNRAANGSLEERGGEGERYPGPLHILGEDPWLDSDDQHQFNLPHNTFQTAHYVWCVADKSLFLFRDYLAVLSVLRLLSPVRTVIHYNSLPQDDALYNKWFQMLKGSVANLELQPLPRSVACGSRALLELSLTLMGSTGGVVFGRNVMLTRALWTTSVTSMSLSEWSRGGTGGLVLSAGGAEGMRWRGRVGELVASSPSCVSIRDYNNNNNHDHPLNKSSQVPCVSLERAGGLFPRHIMTAGSRFAQLARWYFYGTREPLKARPDPSQRIPRITHFVRFSKGGQAMYSDLHLNHYLSILSALYVGGFQRVYLHVDAPPTGRWWQDLTDRGENITLVPVDKALSVFQQPVKVIQHQSDIVRFLLLHKYGGAYQDLDVLWVSRVPDHILSYPAAVAVDKRPLNGADRFNNGVFLTRRKGLWVRNVIQSFKRYHDDLWSYNSANVPYKMFELYPDTVRVDKRLQVLCHSDYACCPWYLNATDCAVDMKGAEPDSGQDQPPGWRKGVLSFHVVMAKPHPSLKTLDTVLMGSDIFAKFARMILIRSGREHLLRETDS